MRYFLICLTLVVGGLVGSNELWAQADSLLGTWEASAESDEGTRSFEWTIKKSGDAFAGEIVAKEDDSKYELKNIKVDANSVSFEFDFEASGEEMLIRVEVSRVSSILAGDWMAMTAAGDTLATGAVDAARPINFTGKWTYVAELPDGGEMSSLMHLSGDADSMKGTVDTEHGQVDFKKIVCNDDAIEFAVVLEVEGEDRNISIQAKMVDDQLKGKWILMDASGGEEATGDWYAKRIKSTASSASPEVEVLFDGTGLDNFQGYSQEEIGPGWTVKDDEIFFDGRRSGDIITRKQYQDFVLEFEWKITKGGNSGVMYRVTQDQKRSYQTGPEYQLLDDGMHGDGKNKLTSTGALYGLYPAQNKQLNPVGQWNSSKIVLKGAMVEHWLNGRKVVQAEIGGADWNQKVKSSKFRKWPRFGKNAKGHICFQDHGNPFWLRNIRVTPIN